jgi:hypothetical protein
LRATCCFHLEVIMLEVQVLCWIEDGICTCSIKGPLMMGAASCSEMLGYKLQQFFLTGCREHRDSWMSLHWRGSMLGPRLSSAHRGFQLSTSAMSYKTVSLFHNIFIYLFQPLLYTQHYLYKLFSCSSSNNSAATQSLMTCTHYSRDSIETTYTAIYLLQSLLYM